MDLEARVRAGGLLSPGREVLILLSGGRDSVCLLDLAVRIAGPEAVGVLHVNYGLREEAASDEAHCVASCERLGVPIEVHRPGPPEGNMQAWARDERYAAAARMALERGADVAAGHTASDQVETVLYRLAASPGRRALLGMRPREGRLVRPLLDFTREQVTLHCEERGLTWHDDPSNDDDTFARNRVRNALMTALRDLHDAAEANVLRTLEILRDEAAVLDDAVEGALREAGWAGGRGAVSVAGVAELSPALRRLVVQRLADAAVGAGAPAIGGRADEILNLATRGGTAGLDLGGGLRAVVGYGELRFEVVSGHEAPAAHTPVWLEVPGRVAFAGGELESEVGPSLPVAEGTLDAATLSARLEVRAWRPGDRMQPLGLGGTKSLQDLFTDRKVPRDARHALPVVLSDGDIAWVPGVATGERFRVSDATADRVRLTWRGP